MPLLHRRNGQTRVFFKRGAHLTNDDKLLNKGDRTMFRNLIKNKKAQNTAEYALLIALVVAGIIAMQQYAQRALQARVRDASTYMVGATNALGTAVQYEPYYATAAHQVIHNINQAKEMNLVGTDWALGQTENSTRSQLGNEETTYGAGATVGTGVLPQGL
jgi:Flp pilus assembly pilin Flp